MSDHEPYTLTDGTLTVGETSIPVDDVQGYSAPRVGSTTTPEDVAQDWAIALIVHYQGGLVSIGCKDRETADAVREQITAAKT